MEENRETDACESDVLEAGATLGAAGAIGVEMGASANDATEVPASEVPATALPAPAAAASAGQPNKKQISLHLVRNAVRGIVLVLFVCDLIRLAMLYLYSNGVIDMNLGRPELSAGLSPLSGLFDLWVFVKTGRIDPVLPASMAIVILGFVMSFALKRTFCSWICPVGTLFDMMGVVGRKITPGIHVSPKVQRVVHAPKFVFGLMILGIIVFVVPPSVIIAVWTQPFWAVSDMAVLRLFLEPAIPLMIVGAIVLGLSLLLGRNYWCDGLCPLGGMYGLASKASPVVVQRNPDKCIGCKKCSAVCGARIAVDETSAPIRTGDCTGCMECVDACPEDDALEIKAFGRFKLTPMTVPALVLLIWVGVWAFSVVAGIWYSQATAQTIFIGMKMLGMGMI